MKKIIRITESDLARIVRRVINEQSEDPNTLIKTIKGGIRNIFDSSEIDYNFIENEADASELAEIIFDSLKDYQDLPLSGPHAGESIWDEKTIGNDEAPVEAAFINMSKDSTGGYCKSCWQKFYEVKKIFKDKYKQDLMSFIKDHNMDIYKKYHKKSIKSCMKSWGVPG